MKHALVTGGAGFIGSHLVDRMLSTGWRVTAVDSFDPFYDPRIKERNIEAHNRDPAFRLHRLDIRDCSGLRENLHGEFDVIVHLAARAGIRPSLRDPRSYVDVNVCGTQTLLELTREWGTPQFVFASSSSVYGVNPNVPWSEQDRNLLPISPYAATKLSGELLGHTYSYLYGIRFLALRLFTVYGPRQRPDLAIHRFARQMLDGRPIPLFGNGDTRRDYTYVSDIVDGIMAATEYNHSGFEVINLGNTKTVSLAEMVRALEDALGVKAVVEYHPEQPGDVAQTWANIRLAKERLNFEPQVEFREGVRLFAEWLQRDLADKTTAGKSGALVP